MAPTEPTIVFAGTDGRALEQMRIAGVGAIMASYAAIGKSKKTSAKFAEATWARRYLDSGVFTFMRRAGVTRQNKTATTKTAASWEEFREFARGFISYVKEHKDQWEHIIELDVDDLFGVEVADMFRSQLREILGDKLLPVWHPQRGWEGWTQMTKDFDYVCLSPMVEMAKEAAAQTVRKMIQEADANGCKVHILGVENIKWFTHGAISFDASSWSGGARWGQFKIAGSNTQQVVVSKGQKQRRAVRHGHISAFEEKIAQWGYTLQDMAKQDAAKQVGIHLLLERQEEARARRTVKATG